MKIAKPDIVLFSILEMMQGKQFSTSMDMFLVNEHCNGRQDKND
jgi:hypothetical protein